MNEGNKRRKPDKSPLIRRTSISDKGKITETQVPLSALKKEALDLSAGSNLPTTLLLTRDAAMKITEQAISAALENAWSGVSTERKSTSTSLNTKMTTNRPATSGGGNSKKPNNPNAANYKPNSMDPKTTKANKPLSVTPKGTGLPTQTGKNKESLPKLQEPLPVREKINGGLEQERVLKKRKAESKSSSEVGSLKKTPKKVAKRSTSSPFNVSKKED